MRNLALGIIAIAFVCTYAFANPFATPKTQAIQANEEANTWTVWVSMTGEPLGMCPSKGFGEQEDHGTWVLCREENGDLYPQYIEPDIMVFTWPVRFVRDQLGWRRIERVKDVAPDPNNRIRR